MCHSAPLRPGCAAPVGNCGPLPGLWAASCPGSGSSPLQPHLRARPQLLTPHLQACPSVRTDPGPGCSNTQFTESQEQYERGSGTVQDVLRLTSRNVCARVHVCMCPMATASPQDLFIQPSAPEPRPGSTGDTESSGP